MKITQALLQTLCSIAQAAGNEIMAVSDQGGAVCQADVYRRFGPTSQWDTAAAQCVLEAAGGAVLDLHNNPLRYGLKTPILNPEFVALTNTTCNFFTTSPS